MCSLPSSIDRGQPWGNGLTATPLTASTLGISAQRAEFATELRRCQARREPSHPRRGPGARLLRPGLARSRRRGGEGAGPRRHPARHRFSPGRHAPARPSGDGRDSGPHLFLARLGDQLRFRAMPPGSRPIVSYALDREAFASPTAARPTAPSSPSRRPSTSSFSGARSIRVTCALGTISRGACRPPRRRRRPRLNLPT